MATDTAPPLLLPEGTRLVHIGPPKTGSTSVQQAFNINRRACLAHGVRYAGKTVHPRDAVRGAVHRGEKSSRFDAWVPLWDRLVAEIRSASEPRVVLSSEYFADAEPDAVARIAAELDPSRLHVVVVLRPLGRLLASQWQQFVRHGTMPYDEWLKRVLLDEQSKRARLFRRRHRDDVLVKRWADVVGPERMTAIVLDERDRGRLLRTFELMLGLSEGTLRTRAEVVNRSMTLPEVEVARAINIALEREGLNGVEIKEIRDAAIAYMKEHGAHPKDPRIETPQWALDRAGEISREVVAGIRASGIRVVGDLDHLAVVPASPIKGDKLPSVKVSPKLAASAAVGVLVAMRSNDVAKGRSQMARRRRRLLSPASWRQGARSLGFRVRRARQRLAASIAR